MIRFYCGLVLLVVALVVPTSAFAQTITEVMRVEGVEKVLRVVPSKGALARGKGDSFYVIVTLRGEDDPVMIESTSSLGAVARRVALPGLKAKTPLFVRSDKQGSVVSYLADGVVHQVSTTRDKVLPSRPLPEGLNPRNTTFSPGGADNFLFVENPAYGELDGVKAVAVIDGAGKVVKLDQTLLIGAKHVGFSKGNKYLVVEDLDGTSWHYSLAKQRRMPAGSRDLPSEESIAGFDMPNASFEERGWWVDRLRGEGKLQVMDNGGVFWSTPHAGGSFAIVDDSIVQAQIIDETCVIQRIDFDGGLAAWGDKRKAGAYGERRQAEADEARRAEEAAQKQQLEEVARREAQVQREAEEKARRERETAAALQEWQASEPTKQTSTSVDPDANMPAICKTPEMRACRARGRSCEWCFNASLGPSKPAAKSCGAGFVSCGSVCCGSGYHCCVGATSANRGVETCRQSFDSCQQGWFAEQPK